MEISIESLMWVKQCHWKTTHDWEWNFHTTYHLFFLKWYLGDGFLGMEFPYHLSFFLKWCLGDGFWHCFTNIIWYLIGRFNPSEKYDSQIGSSSQLLGRIKHAPNHQSNMYIYISIFIHPGANRIWTCQTRSLKWRYHWQSPSLSTSDFDFIQRG